MLVASARLALPPLIPARCCSTATSVEVGRRNSISTPKVKTRSNKNKRNIAPTLIPESDRFEEICRQRNARCLKLFRALRPNPCSSELAEDASVFRNATLLKDKHVLHADYFFFHARDLGDVRDAPRSIVEARDLHHQSD